MEVGDCVVRNLAGIKMPLRVTALTDKVIICGGDEKEHVGWWFDKETGAEIDEDLGWGPPPLHTGSYLMKVANDAGDFVVPESVAKKLDEDLKKRSGG